MSTLASVFGYGLLSARPAASVAGRFYYASDTTLMYRDNGSTWDTLAVGTGSMATDGLWDAAGDLAQGTGANTGAKLSAGSARQLLTSQGAAAANIWAGYSGAKVYNSTTQNISNGAQDAITFDSEDWDTDSYHNTGSNTDRLTIPATGKYRISVNLRWNGGGTNNTGVYVTLMKNAGATLVHGGQVIANNENADGGQVNLRTTLELTATDYLVVKFYNTTGTTRAIGDASNLSQQSTFEIERVLGI